jgi:hypothetical protein
MKIYISHSLTFWVNNCGCNGRMLYIRQDKTRRDETRRDKTRHHTSSKVNKLTRLRVSEMLPGYTTPNKYASIEVPDGQNLFHPTNCSHD